MDDDTKGAVLDNVTNPRQAEEPEGDAASNANTIDSAGICRRLLLLVGLAALLTAGMLGAVSTWLLPRLQRIDYMKAGLHVDTAVTLAPLILLALLCLCAVPMVGSGRQGTLDRILVGAAVFSVILFAIGLVNMLVEKSLTPLLCVSAFLFSMTLIHTLIAFLKSFLDWVARTLGTRP